MKTVYDVKEWVGDMRYLMQKAIDGLPIGEPRSMQKVEYNAFSLALSRVSYLEFISPAHSLSITLNQTLQGLKEKSRSRIIDFSKYRCHTRAAA